MGREHSKRDDLQRRSVGNEDLATVILECGDFVGQGWRGRPAFGLVGLVSGAQLWWAPTLAPHH